MMIMRMTKISMLQDQCVKAAKMPNRSRCPLKVTRKPMRMNLSRSRMRTMLKKMTNRIVMSMTNRLKKDNNICNNSNIIDETIFYNFLFTS